jgi:hypothetical protein
MIYRLSATVIKIALASLLVGVALSAMNITADQVLRDIGLTPERIMAMLQTGITWALPHLILGSMVIVPVWVIIYLFRPPRS